MELNIESVKDCDAMRMKPTDHRPHYITRYDFVVNKSGPRAVASRDFTSAR